MREFGIRDKLAYLSGDLANDFSFILVAMYLMVFYTKVLGISGAVVGTLFLVSRIIDAFTDVTMGRIVDNRVSDSEGKFRWWIIRVAPFVCLSSFLLFAYWVKDFPYTLKLVYIFVTYIMYGSVFYTAINIPYGSMATVISTNSADRAQLSAFRSMGANIAIIILSFTAPAFLYSKLPDGQPVVIPYRFTVYALICSVLAFIFYMLCYYNTVERVKIETKKEKITIKTEIKNVFKAILSSKALLTFILLSIVLLLTSLLISGMNPYLYIDYFKSSKALAVGGAIGSLSAFLLIFLINPIVAKYGKVKSATVSLIFASLVYLFLFIFKISNPLIFLGIAFIAGLGTGYFNMIIWAFISDIIDDQEVRTYKREDGTIYAVYSFARKIGQALSGGLVGYLLTMIGYVSKAPEQTMEVSNKIYNIYTLSGFLGFLICAIILYCIYPLNNERVKENTKILSERKK